MQTEANALVSSSRFVCDGIYAIDFGIVLICANDPSAEAGFLFQVPAEIGSGRMPAYSFAFVDGHQANA